MKQHYDSNFLARWMANELTADELKQFEQSEDYTFYKQIVDELEQAEFPAYNMEANFNATLAKIETQETAPKKVKRLWPIWVGSVAASPVVLVGLLFFLKETSYTTAYAQQQDVTLPDGSTVALNAGSSLAHKTFLWKQNRELNLAGEAFFNVKKGQAFTVNTNQGAVTVLGTQFVVNARPNYFKVICFEGKVKVTTKNNNPIILTKGKAVHFKENRVLENYDVPSIKPDWLSNESSFYNTPVLQVVNELERQYNISIKGKEYLKPAKFTGRFKHDNLNTALKTIFISMDIPYTIVNNKSVVIKKY